MFRINKTLHNNLSQKWSKSWIQKSPSKLNVPYPKTTIENNFRSGGQNTASHMEAKVGKIGKKVTNINGLCARPTKLGTGYY